MVARYCLVEYDEASSEVKEIYDEVMNALGSSFVPNWIKAMGCNAAILRANWEKTKGTLLTGDIPLLLKELIIFSISTHRGSSYCAAAHAHSALQLDKSLTYPILKELVAGASSHSLPESYLAAIEIATKAALSPLEIKDEDFAKLRDVGFAEKEIHEIMAQADLAVMFNTITTTVKLPIDPEYLAEETSAAS